MKLRISSCSCRNDKTNFPIIFSYSKWLLSCNTLISIWSGCPLLHFSILQNLVSHTMAYIFLYFVLTLCCDNKLKLGISLWKRFLAFFSYEASLDIYINNVIYALCVRCLGDRRLLDPISFNALSSYMSILFINCILHHKGTPFKIWEMT